MIFSPFKQNSAQIQEVGPHGVDQLFKVQFMEA